MDLFKLLHVFVALCQTESAKVWPRFWIVLNWICQNCYMDFFKLLHGLVKIDTWISLSCSMYFSPFAKQNQGEVWPRVQTFLKLLLRPKDVDWVKVLNALGLLCLRQCFNLSFLPYKYQIIYKSISTSYSFTAFSGSEVKWSVIVVEGAPPPGILGIDTWAPRQLNGSCKRGSCEGYPQPIKYTNTPRNKNTNTNWRSLWVHVGGKGELGRWEGVNVIWESWENWENWRNALLTQTQ